MNQWIVIAVLTIVEALRRLWGRITGRTPVPVRVPVQRWADGEIASSFFSSRVSLKTDGFIPSRQQRRW
jgi:hypothetical protein